MDEIVLVDLFARNGLYCLGAKMDIFSGVAFTALQQSIPIDRFVLCEEDPDQFRALKIRTNKYFRENNIILLNEKSSSLVEKIKMYVPPSTKKYRVATICVADSFQLEPALQTIHDLGLHGINFIVPVSFHLGNKIDHRFYLSDNKARLKSFLGYISDREKSWRPENNELFYRQLIQIWKSRLQDQGLHVQSVAQRLDSGLMEIPTYQVMLISPKISSRLLQLDSTTGHLQFTLFNEN